MNEFIFRNMGRVFVHILEEIEVTKKTFQNYLTINGLLSFLYLNRCLISMETEKILLT